MYRVHAIVTGVVDRSRLGPASDAIARITGRASAKSRAFEPFFTAKAPGVGTGLGLWVSYYDHDRKAPWPVVARVDARSGRRLHSAFSVMTGNSACRVLVVEDHDGLRRNLVALLEDEDFDVIAAATGEDALECIAGQDIQVAIVDVRLPGIGGLEVIARAARAHPQLRFVIHTGSGGDVLTSDIVALGIGERDVFYKPISDLMAFCARIRCLCRGGR